MIFGESGKSSHMPVEVLLLHNIFRYSRRIPQAGKIPQLGETMLQGLNPTLQEKSHELCTRKSTSSNTFQLLDAGQEWLDFLHLSFRGRRIPRGQFLQFLGGVKWGKAVLVRGGILSVFDIKPPGPPTLYRGSH
jgi:hypothetical protein